MFLENSRFKSCFLYLNRSNASFSVEKYFFKVECMVLMRSLGNCKVRNENLAEWTKSRLDLLWKKQTRARADRPAETSQTEAQRTVGTELEWPGDGARVTRGEPKKASDTATGVPGPGGQGSVVKRQWLQFPRPNLKYQPTEQRSSRMPKQGKHKGSHTKIR